MNKLKKKLVYTFSLLMAAGICSSTVCASYDMDSDGNMDEDDIRYLISVLNGTQSAWETDDINGDGKVNIVDLIELKNMALSDENTDNGKPVNVKYEAVSENVKLMGRSYYDGDIAWLVHSGSAAEFHITASSAEVTLSGDGAEYADEKCRPRYAVFVDDELVEDALIDKNEKTVTLFKGTTQRTADVKIIHLSEANNGAIGIKELNAVSSAVRPVRPAASKKLSIEFIGDSITCAYGVEANSNSESFSTSTENFMKSYAYLTAKKLDADYSSVSYSGYGIISGYTSSADQKNTDSLVPDYYELTAKSYPEKWDFENHHNDVVVVNLGTNDDTYIRGDRENRSPEFTEEYAAFLETVRKNNPDAYIICTVGTMGCAEEYDLIERAVEQFKDKNSDTRVMSYLSKVQNASDGYGADWHPSEITQQKMAYVLSDKICEALGIESDKIGIDAVSDGEHGMLVDKESGANASTYIDLEYTHSIWINTVTGGTKKTDIQAYVSGLKLKAGEYKLMFDCVSGREIEMPVRIEQNYGEHKAYFEDSVKESDAKYHYSNTVKITEDDDNCILLFDIGGLDSYNVTISEISLIKIS